MKLIKKVINGAFIGIGIGFTVNLIYSFINGEYYPGVPSFLSQYDSILIAVTVQTLIYMTLGIIQVFSSDIMNNSDRSMVSNTFIHFSLISLPLLIAAYLLHWGRDVLGLVTVGLSILVVYFTIWLILYLTIRFEINRINRGILNKNQKMPKNHNQ